MQSLLCTHSNTHKGSEESYETHQWQTQKATVCEEHPIALQMIPSACYEFQNDDLVMFFTAGKLQQKPGTFSNLVYN